MAGFIFLNIIYNLHKMSNPWINFLKKNGGKGFSQEELCQKYHMMQQRGGKGLKKQIGGHDLRKEVSTMVSRPFAPPWSDPFKKWFLERNKNELDEVINIANEYIKSIGEIVHHPTRAIHPDDVQDLKMFETIKNYAELAKKGQLVNMMHQRGGKGLKKQIGGHDLRKEVSTMVSRPFAPPWSDPFKKWFLERNKNELDEVINIANEYIKSIGEIVHHPTRAIHPDDVQDLKMFETIKNYAELAKKGQLVLLQE